ncbi:hypothetical protein Csa_013781 [Cucumis sativus]|uniref:Uncharacterized protein n=1 Tax=Cucumis sativus TaxID=3659 RepID=A0A0A0LU65_CUCSA|nr:hypothetical protein Csa_013781 [Cucumis sativus]
MAVPPHTVAVTPRQRVLHSFSSVVITTFLFKSFSMYALICVALRCDYPLALEDESSAPPQPPPFSSDTYSKLHRASFHTCASHCFSWRAEYGIIPIPGAKLEGAMWAVVGELPLDEITGVPFLGFGDQS